MTDIMPDVYATAEDLDLDVSDVTKLSWEDLAAEMVDGDITAMTCRTGGTFGCMICNTVCAICAVAPPDGDPSNS